MSCDDKTSVHGPVEAFQDTYTEMGELTDITKLGHHKYT